MLQSSAAAGERPGRRAIEAKSLSFLADNGFDGLALLLLVAAAIAFGVWLLVLGLLWAASYPRLPNAGPETTDLGPEPPAISNLLVHRFKVTHAAMAATLLDLAARRLLGIDMLGRNNYVIRVRARDGEADGLNPYEQQLFSWVMGQASGGSAPFEALSLGNPGQAERFWKRFEKSVIADARDRGLVRNRWAKHDWTILGAILAVAFGLLALSFGAAGLGDSGEDPMSTGDWLLFAFFGWIGVLGVITRFQDLRDTKKGQEVAGRWLGVRNALRKSTAFNDAPPSHVTIWGQNLSHAVAMGLAHEAVKQLPFEEEDPDTAWTRHTGVWREIDIEYPSRFGWGERPLWVLWGGLWRVTVWGGLAFFVVPIAASILLDIAKDLRANNSDQLGQISPLALNGVFAIVIAFLGGWTVFLLVRFMAGLIRLWRALNDLGKPPIVVEGEVVKLHMGRVAVDDGLVEETKGWIPPPGSGGLSRGMRVRYTRTKTLWYVSNVQVLALPGGETPQAAAERRRTAAASRPGGGLAIPGLSLGAINAATGLTLAPLALSVAGDDDGVDGTDIDGDGVADFAPFGNAIATDSLGDGRTNVLITRLDASGGVTGALMTFVMNRAQRAIAQTQGTGDGHSWLGEENLIVTSGSARYMIRVTGEEPLERRQEIAKQIGRLIVEGPSPAPAVAAAPAAGTPGTPGGMAGGIIAAAATAGAMMSGGARPAGSAAPTATTRDPAATSTPADLPEPAAAAPDRSAASNLPDPASDPADGSAVASSEPLAGDPLPPPAAPEPPVTPRRYTPPPIVYESLPDAEAAAPSTTPAAPESVREPLEPATVREANAPAAPAPAVVAFEPPVLSDASEPVAPAPAVESFETPVVSDPGTVAAQEPAIAAFEPDVAGETDAVMPAAGTPAPEPEQPAPPTLEPAEQPAPATREPARGFPTPRRAANGIGSNANGESAGSPDSPAEAPDNPPPARRYGPSRNPWRR